MHLLILAGGGGTRLWPLSRQDFPKQFLHFGDKLSLLQKSVSRFLDAPFTETISIATNIQYEPLVRQQIEKLETKQKINLIVEPCRKNTTAAIAFSIKYLQEKLGILENDPVLILPSDHLIEPQSLFSCYLEQIEPLVRKGELILFGIRPTTPETGYGYIQIGKYSTLSTHQVKRFVEKPDRALAEKYLASGDYYWNTGIFALSPHLFWGKLAQHAPEINHLMQGTFEEATSRFNELPDISFDYAILEKTKNALVCPLPVSWSDVGCWDSVYDAMIKDKNQNVKFGNVLEVDTKNSLIFGGKRLISTIGLENLLIIETDDVTFISKRGESQKVKNIVNELIKIGKKEGAHHPTQRFSGGETRLLDEGKEYSIQKIQIDGGHTWEYHLPCHLFPLIGTLQLENGTSLPLFESFHLTQGKIINLTQETAELLVFINYAKEPL